jgi:hypothetical protein
VTRLVLPEPEATIASGAVRVHASWVVELAAAAGRPWRSEAGWTGSHLSETTAFGNQVILTQPLAEAGALLDDIGAFFAGAPFMLSSPWPVPDLGAFGLSEAGRFPFMARPAAPRSAGEPDRIAVREALTPADLEAAERVFVEGYPAPDLRDVLPGGLLAPELLDGRVRAWLGIVDEEPVAVAASHGFDGVQLVFYVATLPVARGRGAGTAVSWAATVGDPGSPAVLVASDSGRPMYERMGYLAIDRWSVWTTA